MWLCGDSNQETKILVNSVSGVYHILVWRFFMKPELRFESELILFLMINKKLVLI